MVLVMVVSMLVHQEVVLLQIVDLAAAVEVKILQMAVLAVQVFSFSQYLLDPPLLFR